MKLLLKILAVLFCMFPLIVFCFEAIDCAPHNWASMCGMLTGLVSIHGALIHFLMFHGSNVQGTSNYFSIALAASATNAVILWLLYKAYQKIFGKK